MRVKDGCHHLTGLVSLGEFYKDITKIENGKISFNVQHTPFMYFSFILQLIYIFYRKIADPVSLKFASIYIHQ